MGLFSGIKSAYRKSEAGVVIKNLLEHQAHLGLVGQDPEKLARELVDVVWNSRSEIFDGRFGQRPHELAVAASALANGIDLYDDRELSRTALLNSLYTIFSELEANGALYPLNSLDHQLIGEAMAVFEEKGKEVLDSSIDDQGDEIGERSEYLFFDEWYRAFKVEAGRINPQLKVDEKGNSIVDFMKSEPLERAFTDGIDPVSLARDWAPTFDIDSYLR